MTITYPENSPLYTYDMLILQLIHENWQRRPIYFSMTAGTSNWSRFGDFVTQHGLAFKMYLDEPPDTTRLSPGLFGVPLDVAVTDSLLWHVYRFSDVMQADSVAYDPTSRNIAINLSYPFFGLAWAYELQGDTARSKENIRRGLKLHYLPEVANMLDSGLPVFAAPPALADTPISR
jgi:hypothetical protein